MKTNLGITVLDKGHLYKLSSLDGDFPQKLQFVKRCDFKNPTRFPGNENSYPGATLQMVIRVLIDRVNYLQNQIKCFENTVIIRLLRITLWLLEFRAARRHNKSYWHFPKFAATAPICKECGHTVCEHKKQYEF